MEKYRKFDDPSCGLNPFTPIEPTAKLTGWKKHARSVVTLFLCLLRVPCVLMGLNVGMFLHCFKYIFIVPAIIRWLEGAIDRMYSKLILSTCSYNTFSEKYHREHKDFNFIKEQKKELVVEHQPGEVIICNSTSFIDYIFLIREYSPCFTKIVFVDLPNGEQKTGLRIMGPFETIFCALGLSFPETVNSENSNIFYSIKQLRESDGFLWYRGKRPVVIMPEGTKTNGLGVLNIEPDIVKIIEKAGGLEENLRVHAIRFDHDFNYFAPYNTVDSWGFRNLINIISQFTSKMVIQYYFNLEGVLHDCQNDNDKHEFLKRTLMIRRKEQSMKLSWRDHQEFLTYWNDTNQKSTYSSTEKKNK